MELKINEQVTNLNLTVVEGGESSFPGGDAVEETGATILAKLTSNNVPFPLALLPDANLSATQFTKPGNDIEINLTWLEQAIANMGYTKGGGTGTVNTTPASPTITADDTADTLLASHALGTSEIVMSINDGTYVAYSPISVGNVARSAGYWKFKVKSATGRNESSVVSSPAFTVAAAEPSGQQPVTNWFNINANATQVNSNSFSILSGASEFRFINSNLRIPAGANGYVQMDAIVGTMYLQLVTDKNSIGGPADTGISSFWMNQNAKVNARVDGVYLDDYTGYSTGATVKLRIRLDATTEYHEISVDNGSTWTLSTSTARRAGDNYVRLMSDVHETIETRYAYNIVGEGLTL